MSTLNPQQKKKIEKLYAVIEQGDVAILEYIYELEQKFEDKTLELEAQFKDKLKELRDVVPNMKDILEQVKGKDASPEQVAELLKGDVSFLETVMPDDGLDGNDGETYILTEQDKKDIARSVKVPVVEKIIERTDIIHEQPIVKTEIVKETIKESSETGETIVNKINDLDVESEKIDARHIKGLKEEIIKNIPRQNQGGGFRPIVVLDDGVPIANVSEINFTGGTLSAASISNGRVSVPIGGGSGGGVVSTALLTGNKNSVNLAYTSAASPTASSKTSAVLIDSDNQVVVTYLEDLSYTRSGGNLTFLKAIDNVYSAYRFYLIYT